MSKEYLKSPINYAGGKYRLLKKILPLFPSKINTFVDLFGGAFNVGVNVNAEHVIYNDIIHYLPQLFNYWKETDIEEINRYIDATIEECNLSPTNNDSFVEFRKRYNKNKDIRDLFILICFSFNSQIRFNNSQEYNSSFGKEASTMNDSIRNNLNKFVKTIQEKDCVFSSCDFTKFEFSDFDENDFVYCDSPYSIGVGVYQDGKRGFNGWSKDDDLKLFEILDGLNDKGVKFMMSNVFENKGQTNEELIEWSKKYKVVHLDMNYNGSNYQRKRSKSDEVIIMNY